ncbi:MAG: TonB-dependent receptor plug domain-containing protein [Salibacteraceae bacterium]
MLSSSKVKASLILVFTSFILFGQDTSKADLSEIEFIQLKAFNLDQISIVSDSQKTESVQIYNPVSYNSSANIDQVLQNLGDVQLIKRGVYAFEPQINSMSGGQIAVTLDGMRIFGACTDKMDPTTSYVEPINLKKAEVSCHSSSALEGSNIGGGLNLEARKAKFNGGKLVHGEINTSLYSISNGGDLSGGLNYGSKKFAVRVNGAYRKRNNYTAGDGKEVKYTQYQKSNFSFNGRYRLGKKWIISGDYLFDQANDLGYAALPMDVSEAKTHLGALTATAYNLGKLIKKVEFKAYLNDVYHEMDDSKRPDEEVAMRMDMPGWSKTYGAFAKASITPLGKHNIESKLDYYYNFRRAEMTMYDPNGGAPMFMLTWPDVVRHAAGLALIDNYKINAKNSLALSGRVEYVSSHIEDEWGKRQLTGFGFTGDEVFTHLPYSLGLTWSKKFNSKYSMMLSGILSSRAPTTSEMYGFYLFNKEDGYDYIGLPDIDMENSARINLDINRKSKKLEVRLSGSYNRINNFIIGVIDSTLTAMTIGGNGVKYYENVDWAQFASSTLMISYQPLKKWRASTRFNYNWAQQNNGNAVPQIQPLVNLTSLKYEHNALFVMVECESAAPQDRIDPNFGEDATPSWAVLNLRGGYEFSFSEFKKLNIRGGIENLFDQYYYKHLDWGNVPRPGRNFYLNLGFKF